MNVHYEQCRRYLQEAIELDEQRKKFLASQRYADCCEQAMLGLKRDKNVKSQTDMKKKISEWLSRAETLKMEAQLQKIPLPPQKSVGKISHDYDAIVGLDNVKMALRESILLPKLQPQLFVGERKPWRGILLFGPPGTGKTKLAATVAESAECAFLSVSSSDIMSQYLGDSEKMIRDLFDQARAMAKNQKTRAVIFFDEIDSLGQSRDKSSDSSANETNRRVLTELLKQMDGVGKDNSNITLMAATNNPQFLDAALRRRFERRIYVPLPDLNSRAHILAQQLGIPGVDHQLTPRDILVLAKRTEGFSGADLHTLSNEILLRPVRQCLSAQYFARTMDGSLVPCANSAFFARKMNMLDKDFDSQSLKVPLASWQDALDALSKVSPSVGKKELETILDFDKEFGEKHVVTGGATTPTSESEIVKRIANMWNKDKDVVVTTDYSAWAVSAISATVKRIKTWMDGLFTHWLASKLTELNLDGDISSYITAILETSSLDNQKEVKETIMETLVAYTNVSDDLNALVDDLLRKWQEYTETKPETKPQLSNLWSAEVMPSQTAKPPAKGGEKLISREDREATLRLVQQMQERQLQQELEEEAAATAKEHQEQLEESIASKNRALVQAKQLEAQQERQASVLKHKAVSKAAADLDKKSKEEKKEERQKKAQKGERKR